MKIVLRAPAVQIPTGGVIAYFALAQVLRDLGAEAFVVSEPGLETWFVPPDIQPVWHDLRDVTMEAGDWMITPEWWGSYVAEAGPARILPWCQGPFKASYSGLTLAISRFCAQVVQEQGGEPFVIERVLTPFWHRPETAGARQGVLILPMKNAWSSIDAVVDALRAEGIPVTVAQSTFTPSGLRAELWRHQVYVALSYPEGLDMVCQEAMACGCLVAAYGAGGRREYLKHQVTGWVAEDGDWRGIVRGVHWLLDFPRTARRIADDAAQAIERYRPALATAQAARLLERLNDV